MANYRQDLADRNLGQQTRMNQQTSIKADKLANQKIAKMVRAKQGQQMRDSHLAGSMNQARVQGQQEGYGVGVDDAIGGLGLGQNAQQQMQSPQITQEDVMPYFEQAMQALQEGADPREVDEMISDGVEPEIQGPLRQMLGQAMQQMQAEQGNQNGMQNGVPDQSQKNDIVPGPSMPTAASKAILQQTIEAGQEQRQT